MERSDALIKIDMGGVAVFFLKSSICFVLAEAERKLF